SHRPLRAGHAADRRDGDHDDAALALQGKDALHEELISMLRTPLLHFVAGGFALFCVMHRWPSADPAPPVVLTAADVERLRGDYTRDTGLEPTAADEAALVEKAVEEELLVREAVARGLDRHDRSVHNWLVEQMRVLSEDPGADPERLYQQARALGLDRSDL